MTTEQTKRLTGVFCLAVLTAGGANGAPAGGAWQTEVKAGAGMYFAADIRETDAELDGEFYSGSVELSYAQGRDWRASVGVSTLIWDAQWVQTLSFVPVSGIPFADIEQIGLSTAVFRRINERYGIAAFGSLSWARAKQSAGVDTLSLSDGDTVTLGAVVTYQVNPRLVVSGGLLYTTSLEDDATFIPIVAARYRYSDHLNIRVFEASQIDNFDLIGIDYDRAGDGRLVYSAAILWADQSFLLGRLPDGSGKKVAVEDRAYRLVLSASWQAGNGFFVRPYVGYDLYRKLKFLSDEQTLSSLRARNGWVLGLNLGASF